MALLAQMSKQRETRPNEITYNMVIAACQAGAHREGALATFAAMASDGYAPVAYTKTQLQSLFAGTSAEAAVEELVLKHSSGSGDSRHVPDCDPLTAEKSIVE